MNALEVRRWTRGKHDRLYVQTASGIKIGWFDLRSRRRHLDVPGMWPEFQQAVDQWRRAHDGASGPPRSPGHRPGPAQPDVQKTAASRAVPHPRRPADDSFADDLATREAGHNASQVAERLAPRSRGLQVMAALLGVRTRDRSWRIGAAGERAVGARLDRLTGRGWRVLHAVTLAGGGDIDHLLIGPYGVFTVNTKHHRGAVVRVSGRAVYVRRRVQRYAEQASQEAVRAGAALAHAAGRRVNVAPLIVIHGHRRLHGWMLHRPFGVQVVPSWAVRWWLRLPGRAHLSAADVDELYALARRSSTWTQR